MERVFKLMLSVRGIDVDQDRAHSRGSKLSHNPLSAIGRPDTDPVSAVDTRRHQGASRAIDKLAKLGVGVAQALMARDQRLRFAKTLNRAAKRLPDCVAEQLRV